MKSQQQLINEITQVEQSIAISTNGFKTKSLKEKLSWLKAEQKGNYVTREDLVEYKAYIIFLINKFSFYKNSANLAKAMQLLLDRIENKELVFRTKAGIKGVIADHCFDVARTISHKQLIAEEGAEIMNKGFGQSRINDRFKEFYMSF